MPGIELIRSFLEQASAQGSRSTALAPLGWLAAIAFSAFVTCASFHTPDWCKIGTFAIVAVVTLAYVTAYSILMFTDREALRSERYSLSKMAIEKSVAGDDIAGFMTISDGGSRPLLASKAAGEEVR